MNQNMTITGKPQTHIFSFRPPAVVAAGATVRVSQTNGPKSFKVTHIGFTSTRVGIPAIRQPYRLFIQDVGGNTFFSNETFDADAVFGADSQNPAFLLPMPYDWGDKGQITVEFTNVGTLASLPSLLMIGFLQ